MDKFSFLGGEHIAFVEEMYEKYQRFPDQTEPSWRAFFQGFDFALEEYGDSIEIKPKQTSSSNGQIPDKVIKEFHVIELINAYRQRGHLFTKTNPVRARRQYSPGLEIEQFGLSQLDLDTEFQAATELSFPKAAKLRDIITHLEDVYCKSIGVEYMYIRKPEVRKWIKDKLSFNSNQPSFSVEEKRHILKKLNQAVSFESFLNTKFVGQKRFSVEGAESLIPALDKATTHGATLGVKEYVVGMAHRGRLNVLSNIFGKTQRDIFSEFEGKEFEEVDFDGDVKYHLGYSTLKQLEDGNTIKLSLAPNPSHLEAVDAIVSGIARAQIDDDHQGDYKAVMPILIHGDAAVAGQGIVYEVIQMETLDGYKTGGTLHIVINNQVGFTTNYLDARSSTYCTDIAKVVLAPVLHVNGDDAEAVVHAVKFAVEYRQMFGRDVFVDLLCYRKYGHNEGDEPRFTQPLLYKTISRHPNPRDIYKDKLLKEGSINEGYLSELEKEFKEILEMKFDESKKIEKNKISPFLEDVWAPFRRATYDDFNESPNTGVEIEKLRKIASVLTTLPEGKKFFNKIVRLINDRKKMVEERNALDWGMAELLAYGTLVSEGHRVRLSGEDCERGTFSHRHAVIVLEDSEEEVVLLNNIEPGQAKFEAYNSHLSEYGVMGFDYGYAMAKPDALVIWEAQFGDFANGAQIIIDQFLSAAEDKWKMQNGLVMYLPHGYEGQGAEHSSARLERFLQLCAQLNMQVLNITTPANLFHMLRRQVAREFRKPAVLMSPKSLLRHPKCTSTLEELAEGRFQEIIDDASVKDKKKVEKVVLCSGKICYELLEEKENGGHDNFAIIRIEQLYPLPEAQIKKALADYPNHKKVIWAQEEPSNMGAHWFMKMRTGDLITDVVTSKNSASPASGSHQAAVALQKRTVKRVFEI